MVGINIVLSKNNNKSILNSQKIEYVQKKMLHLKSYRSKKLFQNSKIIIGSTAYEEYPIEIVDDESSIILIEGMIYNMDDEQIKELLHEIVDSISNKEGFEEKIRKFQFIADGEFIIVIYDKNKNGFCLFNDSLGRLPLYWYEDDNLIIISREIKFIYPYLKKIKFEKKSLVEYLLFGFVLGERTLIKRITRLMPSSFIFCNADSSFNGRLNYPVFLAKHPILNKGEDYSANFKRYFLLGLESRVNKLRSRKQIISLSGGLDSRGTLAGLIKFGVSPNGIANTTSKSNEIEFTYSKKIAKEFGIPLNPFKSKINRVNFEKKYLQ